LPGYYFIIRYSDHEHGDDEGTLLPHDGAARDYALRVIRELNEDSGYDDLAMCMVVTDEAGRQVFIIPFSDARSIH
jgi:hypothetical protein